MKESAIINHVIIDGVDVLFNTLPAERESELEGLLSDRVMLSLGFIRDEAARNIMPEKNHIE